VRLWPGRRGRKPAQPPYDDSEWESREAFLDRLNNMRDAAEQREAFDKYVAKHAARKRARRRFWHRKDMT
jgi:hypothetical protein